MLKLMENYPLAKYTTLHVGGCAEFFYQPTNLAELKQFLSSKKNDRSVFWLGNGSNLLIRDGGIKGIVIYPKFALDYIQQISAHELKLGSATTINSLVRYCLQNRLTGLEFLAGIPGTIGGALAMNAGVGSETIWSNVKEVETINDRGGIKNRKKSEFKIDYRSVIMSNNEWFINSYIAIKGASKEAIRNTIISYQKKRIAKQPIGTYNCGSVFKNPPNQYAAQLIESCGLKGKKVGGAIISPKHSNFIINTGTATAIDVEQLILLTIDQVKDKYGIVLEPEVKIIGTT